MNDLLAGPRAVDFIQDMPAYLVDACGGFWGLRDMKVDTALETAESIVAKWVADGSKESTTIGEIKRWIERHKPVDEIALGLPRHLVEDFANASRLNVYNSHATELRMMGLINWYSGTWSRPACFMYTMQGKLLKARMGL